MKEYFLGSVTAAKEIAVLEILFCEYHSNSPCIGDLCDFPSELRLSKSINFALVVRIISAGNLDSWIVISLVAGQR